MAENRLNIISVEAPSEDFLLNAPPAPSRTARLREMRAKYERLWLLDPERFNPLRNVMEQERLERTWKILTRHTFLMDQKTVDIGCGSGVFSHRLQESGAQVEAVDIAENALKILKNKYPAIPVRQTAMPETSLADQQYDIVVCTELIAEIAAVDYRLFFAELSRVIRPSGFLVFSSAIDIYTDHGSGRLFELAQTEFDILDHISSYHALSIRLKHFFEGPSLYTEGWENKEFYRNELKHRKGFNRLWFWGATSPLFVWISYGLRPLFSPILKGLKTKRSWLLKLEKICQALWHQRGISNEIFIAKQRPLRVIDPEEIPVEKPKRKEIWD